MEKGSPCNDVFVFSCHVGVDIGSFFFFFLWALVKFLLRFFPKSCKKTKGRKTKVPKLPPHELQYPDIFEWLDLFDPCHACMAHAQGMGQGDTEVETLIGLREQVQANEGPDCPLYNRRVVRLRALQTFA